jgi:hypothetical protein
MGESKRRGSREDRVAAAVEERRQKQGAIKQQLGIPEEAEFFGYVIHHTENDEYVQAIEDTPQVIKRAFTPLPEEGMRFAKYLEANQFVRPEKGERIVGLFKLDGAFVTYVVG